jgi:CBS domain-containing protein
MGDKGVRAVVDGEERRRLERRLLDDLRALEQMIDSGAIESGVRRIGAEQEIFLVDPSLRPTPAALQLIEALSDRHFTTELGLFQLELNLDPLPCAGDCLSRMERSIDGQLARVRAAGEVSGVQPVLAGILPTLRVCDLGLENMTPLDRYRELNRAVTGLRGEAYELHIRGLDELLLQHDSVMLEACTASFQVHLQVGADEFARMYNAAQAAAGPTLAVATNSPLLFGRQLWSETRIALFQQAVDTRSSLRFLRERSPRVTFGEAWLRRSVLELFQEDLVRFRALITGDLGPDPLVALAEGRLPELRALQLFNGTVYRWNRACYGVTDGRPHLRIENRVLPAGPSVVDEVANAAFWIGLVVAIASRGDVTTWMDFEDAKANFATAARHGLAAPLIWLGESVPAARLVTDRLLPLAHEGLAGLGLDEADRVRYLDVVERRASSFRGGAQWFVRSLAAMRRHGTAAGRMGALTAALVERQLDGRPVAEWEPAHLDDVAPGRGSPPRVEQYMTTELFTVGEDESLDLVANLMEWKRIRHVPVEDGRHRLIGLVSYRRLLRLVARGQWPRGGSPVPVREIMQPGPITVGPRASILEAIELMRAHRVSCLPVVEHDQLVGILTERDLMGLAADVLEERLGRP